MTEESPNQPSAGRDVFVSYASQDAAVANAVVEALERQGIKCWIAPRDVKPGAAYAEAIVRAINEASALVLVLSGAAMASEHVSREVERAGSKRKQIIAFKIDAAALSAELEYFLSRSQWIDVTALGMPGALARLKEAVGQGSARASPADPVLGSGSGSGGGSGGPAVSRAVGTASVAKRVLIAAAAIVLVGVAGTLAVHFWPLKHGKTPAVAAISDKSIAVLPFADMSEKKDQEYFGDGMAEEILDLLAKIPGLTVIGRTSSFQFKGKNEDLRTIGTKLNVAYVLEGSVRNSGDQVRITAQLINTRTGAHEWSETYDRHIGDVLKLQDAIAAGIVRELQLTVAPGNLNSRGTVNNAQAYDLYLRGRHAADRWDQQGFDEAVSLFRQSLDRDPTFVPAETALAWAYIYQGEFGFLATATAFDQGRRAAAAALKLDPRSAEAHNILGEIHIVYDWDWAAADRELHLAETLSSGSANLSNSEAMLSLALGHWDDALRHIGAAQVHDPLDPSDFIVLSWIQHRRGHLLEAEAAARRALEIRPNYGYAHFFLGEYVLARGDLGGALLEMQKETSEGRRTGLAVVYYALGKKAESDSMLSDMLNGPAADAFGIASVYAFRGQTGDAMQWLERAYAQKHPDLFQLKGNPLLKNLEPDLRYKAFLRKMNLPE